MTIIISVLLLIIIAQDIQSGHGALNAITSPENKIICKAIQKCPRHHVTMYIKKCKRGSSEVVCFICKRENAKKVCKEIEKGGLSIDYETQDRETINQLIDNTPQQQE